MTVQTENFSKERAEFRKLAESEDKGPSVDCTGP